METVWLEWHGPFPATALDTCDNDILDLRAGIYVTLDSKPTRTGSEAEHELLYVGMVFGESVYQRIVKHQSNGGDGAWRWIMNRARHQVTLKVAAIYPEDERVLRPCWMRPDIPITSIFPREGMTARRQLVKDIENLLIFRLQPPGNIQGKETCTGRRLRVVNTGRYSPLPEELRLP